MKKSLLFAAACCLAFSASAQHASEMESTSFGSGDQIGNYNIVGISYDWTNVTAKEGGYDDSKALNGFGVEYIHGFPLSSSLPMYLEAGAKFSMGFMGEDEDWSKVQLMRINVPVSFAWRFNLIDNITITPYVGVDFRVNCMARQCDGSGDWHSLFDEEQYDPTAKRFQMGWHLGARVEYNRISLGVSGGTDFIDFYKDGDYKWQTSNLAVTVGYRF